MGLSSGQAALITFIIASLLVVVAIAEKTANPLQNDNVSHPNLTPRPPKKFQVGDEYGWFYGYDYAEWAHKNAPFYVNDTLVFKYDGPYFNFPQSVALLPDLESFEKCDLSKAKLVANKFQGQWGFEFVLNTSSPYYFASNETYYMSNCKDGKTKLFVQPLPRPSRI